MNQRAVRAVPKITTLASSAPEFEELFAARCRRNAVDIASEPLVLQILEDVRRRGDDALVYWTQKLDKVALRAERMRITPNPDCLNKLDSKLREALETAANRIAAYHRQNLPRGWYQTSEDGVQLGSRVTPLERVGIYVPGGKAAYPSTVLMCAVPARVAGVQQIVMTTPPKMQHLPLVIEAAAVLAGVSEIYHVGGAQAIAAMAFGTKTIAKVDKIVGPGNKFVAEAKRLVYGLVDIDSIAGPSEVCIIADGSAPADWVAADALAQAEHDEAAAVLILTLSDDYAAAVVAAIGKFIANNPRAAIAASSLEQHGLIVICSSLDQAIALSNRYAPEHLELCVANAETLLDHIQNAGAIFIGPNTPEAVGDYLAGPNHVLPTQGTARFFSPLGVEDYIKRTSLMQFSAAALKTYGPLVAVLADCEGLYAHAQSVLIRSGQ